MHWAKSWQLASIHFVWVEHIFFGSPILYNGWNTLFLSFWTLTLTKYSLQSSFQWNPKIQGSLVKLGLLSQPTFVPRPFSSFCRSPMLNLFPFSFCSPKREITGSPFERRFPLEISPNETTGTGFRLSGKRLECQNGWGLVPGLVDRAKSWKISFIHCA